MTDFIMRGDDYLKAYHPNFKLLGRDDELKRLASIIMRGRANSLLLIGPGGVGCTALCLGLQALKSNIDAPFDIVSKRLFWLDTDGLFSSGDAAATNKAFQKIMDVLYRTPDSILIIEDTKDFIEGARNNGSSHFINALNMAVKNDKTQVILEARDDDLDVVLKCHSDMKECYTIMDLEEPINGALLEIVTDSAKGLTEFHGIKISPEAITTAIELTNKYRTRDMGLSRAQPERSITLLDRALSSYRLSAHETPPSLAALKKAGNPEEIKKAEDAWFTTQATLKGFHRQRRDAEFALINAENELAEQQLLEKSRHEGEENTRPAVNRIGALMSGGGFDSQEVAVIKQRIKQLNEAVTVNKTAFDKLTEEINANLMLDRALVLEEFSKISGIAVNKLNEDDRAKLNRLEDSLHQRIFGQDAVVTQVANGIKVARLGRRKKDDPLAFLFMGPSGVGKTELAKAIAFSMLDDERALTRFDMSEYMEKHAVAKMIGAPPGYEGFEVGGILTNAMRKNPNRVLLFDEIEKAHPDVFNIFLQILDGGRLTDNVGRTVSFSDAIIIMTTNIGQAESLDITLTHDEIIAKMNEKLAETYRSEFLNRFNGRQNILCFSKLNLQSIEKIVLREISRIHEAYADSIDLVVNNEEMSLFCSDQYDPIMGARGLPGYIKAHLEPIIVNHLLEQPDSNGSLIVGYKDHKFTFQFEEKIRERSAA